MQSTTIAMNQTIEEQEQEFTRKKRNVKSIMDALGADDEAKTITQMQNAVIAPHEIDRLIASGLSGKDICFMLAIRSSYGQVRGVTINGSSFCEKWGFKEEDFHLAIARLHKKQIITAPVEAVVQLELFPEEEL